MKFPIYKIQLVVFIIIGIVSLFVDLPWGRFVVPLLCAILVMDCFKLLEYEKANK